MSYAKTCKPNNLTILGDLAARSSLLAGRLEKKEYRPETILTMDQSGWPGDWEGRTILALCRLAEVTHREPAYLREIIEVVLSAFNEKHYLGRILPEGEFDEQQLSGHSWLLRGLVAYYNHSGDKRAYDAAVRIGENLFLPAAEAYNEYPNKPEDRVIGGAEAGNIAKIVGSWHISTDTGCAYIPLDGVSALYEMTGDERFGKLLEIMIENFLEIDFLSVKAQTHATLTGTRGILRTYAVTGNQSYLDTAEKLFDMYKSYGMTANYANYNWFGRPEWTEPCAIIDSFIVAIQLGIYTGKTGYFTDAQRIFYNGIGFGQRENGGFGCDNCTGSDKLTDSHLIRISCYEASWCCTMRGGEGLAAAAEYAYIISGNRIVLPYFTTSDADIAVNGGHLALSQKSKYPYEGKVVFTITENTLTDVITMDAIIPETATNLKIFGAEYMHAGNTLSIVVTKDTTSIEISFDMPVFSEAAPGKCSIKDKKLILRGNALLSCPAEDGVVSFCASDLADAVCSGYTAEIAGRKMRYLFDAYETDHEPRQVLFEINA